MNHVYWVTDRLAGRCGPSEYEWDLDELYDKGFRAIVSLDDKINPGEIKKRGFIHVPLYVPDVVLSTSALKAQFLKAVDTFIEFVSSFKEPVLVHCHAGNDRTGAILACFLVSQGKKTEEAISEIRKLNPCAMTTPGYEDVVYLFAKS